MILEIMSNESDNDQPQWNAEQHSIGDAANDSRLIISILKFVGDHHKGMNSNDYETDPTSTFFQ